MIARGVGAADVVWEDAQAIAFFPDTPAVVGHTLVAPKVHVRDFWKAQPSLTEGLAVAVLTVGKGIMSALQPDGMNLITSAGEAASQTVNHLHLHVVPRWENDRIGRIWPPDRPLAEQVKEDVAERIRAALRGQP